MILRGVASALPPHKFDSKTVAGWCESDNTFLCQKVGIRSRYLLSMEESELDLAHLACRNLFVQNPDLDRNAIGLCIYVGQIKTRLIPHASALLQAQLGLPVTCACFDVGLACSGYAYALIIAQSLMTTQNIKHALIVTCEPYSQIINRRDKNTAPLFGDAASATWLSSSGRGLLLNSCTDFGTDGSKADYLEYTPASLPDSAYLSMDGRGIFNFVMHNVPISLSRCLQKANLTLDDIDCFLFHQANRFILETLCDILQIPEKKCPIEVAEVANTVSSSIPLLLAKFLPLFNPGQRVVLCGFGGGLSWATILAKFSEVPNE